MCSSRPADIEVEWGRRTSAAIAAATRGSLLLGAGEEPPTTRPCAGVGAYEADTGLFGAAMTGLGAGVELAFARVWPLPEKLSDLGLPKQLPMMIDVRKGRGA